MPNNQAAVNRIFGDTVKQLLLSASYSGTNLRVKVGITGFLRDFVADLASLSCEGGDH